MRCDGPSSVRRRPRIDDGMEARSSSWRTRPHSVAGLFVDHRTLPAMALVDDMEEDVGGIGAVRQIADFVDDEQIGMRVRREGIGNPSCAKAAERSSISSASGQGDIEAVLNPLDRQSTARCVFPAPRLAARSSARPSVTKSGDSAEPRARPQGRLMREIEIRWPTQKPLRSVQHAVRPSRIRGGFRTNLRQMAHDVQSLIRPRRPSMVEWSPHCGCAPSIARRAAYLRWAASKGLKALVSGSLHHR